MLGLALPWQRRPTEEESAAHNGDAPRAWGGTGGCPVGRGAHHGDDFMLDDAGGSLE